MLRDKKCEKSELDSQIQLEVNDLFDQNTIHTKIAYEQSDLLVGFDLSSLIWYLYLKNIVVLYFKDQDDLTRLDSYDLLFQLYTSNTGIYAVVVSKQMNFVEAHDLMVEVCQDPYDIAFAKIQGWRLPLININRTPKTIGTGKIDPPIQKLMTCYQTWIKWFDNIRWDELTSIQYFPELDDVQKGPPDYFFEEVFEMVNKQLDSKDLLQAQKYEYRFDVKSREDHKFKIYEQKGLKLVYDVYFGIWAICTPYFLMIDFDVKDDYTMSDAITDLQKFTDQEHQFGNDYLFWLYQTDNGLHSFLMNQPSHYTSESTKFILESLDNDNKHIEFTYKNGHCTRVGPKLFRQDKLSKKGVLSEFISKKCFEDVCTIGYGTPLPYFIKILTLHDSITAYLKMLYKTNFKAMVDLHHIVQTNSYEYTPKSYVLEQIRNYFIDVLVKLGLYKEDLTFVNNFKVFNPNRYRDLMSDSVLEQCGSNDLFQLKAFIEGTLKPHIQETCDEQVILLKSEDYPFILIQDAHTHMILIVNYDILMLDWDVKDGINKPIVVEIINRFIINQNRLPENERLFKSTPCFKIFETSNGIHSYLLSHFVPHDSEQMASIMMAMCADYYYMAFSQVNGYSSRLTPKVYDKTSESYYSQKEVAEDFIQKIGLDGIEYIGDQNNINHYIEEFVDNIYRLQQFVLDQDDLYDRLIGNDKNLQKDIVEVAMYYCDMMVHRRNETVVARWVHDYNPCYITFLEECEYY